MEDLAGKVAVVTGGGGGIGLATAKALAAEGMKVVVADVDEERLDGAIKLARDQNLDISGCPTDVSDFASVQALADYTYRQHGNAHVVHLNAGISSYASLLDNETEPWFRAVGVNLLGVVWGIKAFVPRMVEAGQPGLVLATSSGAGAEGTSYKSPGYAATKNAVVSIMEALYGQLRDSDSNVRAGLVFPPLTETNLAGNPETMKFVEGHLQSTGVPAVLVQPAGVAAMIVDGIKRDRFFIRVDRKENDQFFEGAHGDEYFGWNERMIRGRSEQQLGDGAPDPYLW